MSHPIPTSAHLIAPVADLSFLDSQSIPLPHPITAMEAWDMVMSHPLPGLKLAFRIRDAISSRFGVQPINGFSGVRKGDPKPGDHLDFFLIEDMTPTRLSLTARDKHLSTMTCVTVENQTLAITSSVITHNRFGRIYMLPVAPAHRLIVKRMLKGIARRLAKLPPTAGQ